MNKWLQFDWILLGAVMFLGGIGALALYSISPDAESGGYAFRQLIFFGCGVLGLFLFASFDYRHIQKYSTPLYFGMLTILIGVLLWGKTVHGTEGWINLGIARFQPVEAAKPILVLFLASFISKKKTELGELVRLMVSFMLSFVLIILVLKQPDLGSALVLAGIWVGMILISGMRFKHFTVMVMIGFATIAVGWSFLAPYQRERVIGVIEPQIDPQGSGYNVIQATVAVGSGGIIGKGIGHGSQSQLNFLPEKHTDFIFSVIAEELGLIGSFLVIFLYGVILYRLSRIALSARDNFGFLMTAGVMLMIFIHVAVNIGMNIGLLPVTGIPLPFLSYGGSSLLSMMLSLGLVMSIFLKKKNNSGLQVSLDRSML
jgi:rod shape determining protein RodA